MSSSHMRTKPQTNHLIFRYTCRASAKRSQKHRTSSKNEVLGSCQNPSVSGYIEKLGISSEDRSDHKLVVSICVWIMHQYFMQGWTILHRWVGRTLILKMAFLKRKRKSHMFSSNTSTTNNLTQPQSQESRHIQKPLDSHPRHKTQISLNALFSPSCYIHKNCPITKFSKPKHWLLPKAHFPSVKEIHKPKPIEALVNPPKVGPLDIYKNPRLAQHPCPHHKMQFRWKTFSHKSKVWIPPPSSSYHIHKNYANHKNFKSQTPNSSQNPLHECQRNPQTKAP